MKSFQVGRKLRLLRFSSWFEKRFALFLLKMFLATAALGDRQNASQAHHFIFGSPNVKTSPSPPPLDQQLFSFYMLKRQNVIFACKWVTPAMVDADGGCSLLTTGQKMAGLQTEQEHKLLSGLLYSMKGFCRKLDPSSPSFTPLVPDSGFKSFTTPFYKLHYYETPTGYKFAMLTAPSVADLDAKFLKPLYSDWFVPHVIRCPGITAEPGYIGKIFSLVMKDAFQKLCPQLLICPQGPLVPFVVDFEEKKKLKGKGA